MVSSKVSAISGVSVMSLLAISVVTVGAAPVITTDVQVREAGTMAEYLDQQELVKRINLGLFTTILLGFEKVASTACAADIEPATKTAICAIAVVGSVTALLYGAYKALNTDRMLKERQILDVRAPSQIINLVPQIAGKSHTNALYEQYTGIPILIGYHDCFGPGCFETYYQNHMSKGGRLLHHQESGDDGGLYGDYLYHNDNEGTEEGLAGAEDQTTFEDNLEHDVDDDEWTNTGIHCFNVYNSDTGVVGSAGYFSLNNDTPYQDPDNEDSYISQCESKGISG
ncbi:hypothetical protein KCU93_g8420, partial [Aureobasidium melanogenum]